MLEYCVKDDIKLCANSESASYNVTALVIVQEIFIIFPISVLNKQNRNLYSKTPPLKRCVMKECQHFTKYKSAN